MIQYLRSVALHLLRKHIVKQCRQMGGFSWSAINKILMSLGLPQMEKTAVLDGKTKVYFKDGETMVMEDTFIVTPIKKLATFPKSKTFEKAYKTTKK